MSRFLNIVKAMTHLAGLTTPRKVVRWNNIDFEVEDEYDGYDDDARDMRRIFNKSTGAPGFYPCEGHWNIRSSLLEDFEHTHASIYDPMKHPIDLAKKDAEAMERMFLLIETIYPRIATNKSGYPFKKMNFETLYGDLDEHVDTLIKRYDVLDGANQEAKPGDRTYNLDRLTGRIEHGVFACMHDMVTDLKGGMGTIMTILEKVLENAYRAARKEQRALERGGRSSGRRNKASGSYSPTVDSNGPTVDGEDEARAPAEPVVEEEAPADIPTAEDIENDDTPTVIEVGNFGRNDKRDLKLGSKDLDDITRFLELYCRYHAYRLRQTFLHPDVARPLGKVRLVDHWQGLYMTLASQHRRDFEWKRKELWTDDLISILESVELAARMETFFGKNIQRFWAQRTQQAMDKFDNLDEVRYQFGLAAFHYGFWDEEPKNPADDASQDGWSLNENDNPVKDYGDNEVKDNADGPATDP